MAAFGKIAGDGKLVGTTSGPNLGSRGGIVCATQQRADNILIDAPSLPFVRSGPVLVVTRAER